MAKSATHALFFMAAMLSASAALLKIVNERYNGIEFSASNYEIYTNASFAFFCAGLAALYQEGKILKIFNPLKTFFRHALKNTIATTSAINPDLITDVMPR
ncbi:MAG: hypothetical protein COY58_07650 [Gammaproteobacteria bacterium CG_4_10_14_0_8_um_filter_38_16]|nr:MAG: hypothetical protein COY58_07650 [Gammaproteobacteria bacterium CG_4_10_14_0_8_um_filter_38_16]PJA03425.1 MAG: hypothetical protein COX72_04900 [Gammaproteobacteria bacterium CG_4_10_14_0_2_um_filter_38_22]PJB10580.1 MAG: hypothetical protein CO120_03790 [Gammaproteobacteria bacterium CG_4_9_14_3_um_filter_38_9]